MLQYSAVENSVTYIVLNGAIHKQLILDELYNLFQNNMQYCIHDVSRCFCSLQDIKFAWKNCFTLNATV